MPEPSRPGDLLDMVNAGAAGHMVDEAAYAVRLRAAVADIVRTQADLGIDVVDDGEMSKPGFIHYVNQRLSGFEAETRGSSRQHVGAVEGGPGVSRVLRVVRPRASQPRGDRGPPRVHGSHRLQGPALLRADLDNLSAALDGVARADVFVPAISPSNSSTGTGTRYYKTTRSTSSRSARRCARSTWRSSTRGSRSRSTIRAWSRAGFCNRT